AAAERRGAQLWGADWCRYSTGGSTHANQVAALAVASPGQTVLVARTAHRSTVSALVLAGLAPVWLTAEVDTASRLPTGLDLAALADALAAHPDAAAVFCVEPGYVGTVSDLPAVVALAHDHGVPVVVDQAWGAHFGFHPAYPRHALAAGADVLITSAHKTLPAYSQAAIVLARTSRLDAARLDRAVDLSATTSPSGAILASIDAARALLGAPLGRDLLARLAELVGAARARLHDSGIATLDPGAFAAGRFDPAKLVVLLDRGDGNAIERELIGAGVPVEQADRDMLVPIVTMLDDETTIDRLCTVLEHASQGTPRARTASPVWTAAAPPSAISPRDAFFGPHEVVPAAQAVGRVSAEMIAPYPPGIPVLVPGELITAEMLDTLAQVAAGGARIAYARDATLRTFEVVIE
ncbi:MAG TPA: aminotransferase class V-fold PLP-dependent enzyme, partial [Jatrophihabitantaceae bacterium]